MVSVSSPGFNMCASSRLLLCLALFAPFLRLTSEFLHQILSRYCQPHEHPKRQTAPCKFFIGSCVRTDLILISCLPKTIRSISSTPSKLSARQTVIKSSSIYRSNCKRCKSCSCIFSVVFKNTPSFVAFIIHRTLPFEN